jgi:hypothetical protein
MVPDTISPKVEVLSPTEYTIYNYSNITILLNVTEDYVDTCWYTQDNSNAKIIMSNCSKINKTWSRESHRVTVFTNDTSGNVNSTIIKFAYLEEKDENNKTYGSNEKPYPIRYCYQLEDIEFLLNFSYELIQDVDCTGTVNWDNGKGFNPIGNSSAPFIGNFYGNNFNITGLFINRSTENDVGLFAKSYLDEDHYANFYDINMVDAYVSGNWCTGILGSTGRYSSVNNTYISGKIISFKQSGGFFGNLRYSTITNSHANVTIDGYGYAGQFIGTSNSIVLENCSGMGYIKSPYDYSGGLIGRTQDSIFTNSYFIGTINGTRGVGSIVGWGYDSKIEKCYSIANVSGTYYVGGLAGEAGDLIVNNSYSKGNISGVDYVGGISGYGSLLLYNSYSSAIISGNENIGGLHGFSDFYSSNSFFVGTVLGNKYVGGLAGDRYSNSNIMNNSYWNNNTNNPSHCWTNETGNYSIGCNAINDNISYFYNIENSPMGSWNFRTVWSPYYNKNDTPVLQWQDEKYKDFDNDGITDGADKLYYDESDVNSDGVSLSISIGDNTTSESFYNNEYEIDFYDNNELLINFSHNFTQGTLDLSKVRIIKDDDVLIVNFSNQVQGTKTLFIDDNNFDKFCVKDAVISTISEISDNCDGANEYDFSACLGSSLSLNGISCVDLGDRLKVSNLSHSALRGTPVVVSSSSSSSGSSWSSRNKCGNGICQDYRDENCTTCPQDCGECVVDENESNQNTEKSSNDNSNNE